MRQRVLETMFDDGVQLAKATQRRRDEPTSKGPVAIAQRGEIAVVFEGQVQGMVLSGDRGEQAQRNGARIGRGRGLGRSFAGSTLARHGATPCGRRAGPILASSRSRRAPLSEPRWPSQASMPINVDRALHEPDQPDDEFAYWSN